jgi:predicted small secreted protein
MLGLCASENQMNLANKNSALFAARFDGCQLFATRVPDRIGVTRSQSWQNVITDILYCSPEHPIFHSRHRRSCCLSHNAESWPGPCLKPADSMFLSTKPEASTAWIDPRAQVWSKCVETSEKVERVRARRTIEFLLIALTLGMAVTLAACFTMQKVGCDLLQLTSCPTETPTP